MSEPTSVSVKHEGHPIQLSFTSCRVFMAGEFAGNVELAIDCDPSLQTHVEACLRLQSPGEDTSEECIARSGPEDGFSLVFWSDAVARLAEAPDSLSFLWCDEPIASVATTLADSLPLEQVHALIDPLLILGTPPMPSSDEICLQVQRDWVRLFAWLTPALPILIAGAALCLAPYGWRLEDIPHREIAGSLLIAVGIALAAAGCRIPKREIWFELNRRQIAILEGRTLSATPSLADAKRIELDGFAHVRLCERHTAPEISDDSSDGRSEWIVSLEGPIPYAFDDGRVHSRSDAVILARFAGERRARRFAARVAYHAGLRILEATDW
jgi:hypothetical protein